MKKMTMLKSIATLAFLLVVGMNLSAQVIATLPAAKAITAPGDTSSVADTVSIGAVMPYFVHPDAAIKGSALYNPSGFKWTITGAGATLNTGSLTPTAIGGVGTYYTDTMVNATFATLGNITLSTIERSSPKFSVTSGCDGNQRDLAVNVIKLPSVPTIAPADVTQGGCGSSATYTVKFDFSSNTKFPIYISYTISAFDINNNPVGTPVSRIYQINGAASYITVDKTTDLDAASASGVKYTVALGNMWDRISANATNRNALNVNASPLSASILILPTPKTGIIKHIKTL